MQKQARNMERVTGSVRHLAEAIMLQSLEDLWDEGQRRNCLTFFRGRGFTICAEIAGINISDQRRLLGLVNKLTGSKIRSIKNYQNGTNIEYSVSRG